MKANVRKATSLALVVTGLLTLITGLWNFFPPFNDRFSPGHAYGACVFAALCLVHVWLNRGAVRKYLKRVGWRWLLVGSGVVATVLLVAIPLARM